MATQAPALVAIQALVDSQGIAVLVFPVIQATLVGQVIQAILVGQVTQAILVTLALQAGLVIQDGLDYPVILDLVVIPGSAGIPVRAFLDLVDIPVLVFPAIPGIRDFLEIQDYQVILDLAVLAFQAIVATQDFPDIVVIPDIQAIPGLVELPLFQGERLMVRWSSMPTPLQQLLQIKINFIYKQLDGLPVTLMVLLLIFMN